MADDGVPVAKMVAAGTRIPVAALPAAAVLLSAVEGDAPPVGTASGAPGLAVWTIVTASPGESPVAGYWPSLRAIPTTASPDSKTGALVRSPATRSDPAGMATDARFPANCEASATGMVSTPDGTDTSTWPRLAPVIDWPCPMVRTTTMTADLCPADE